MPKGFHNFRIKRSRRLIKDALNAPTQEKSQVDARGQISNMLVTPSIDSVAIRQIVEEVLR